MRYNNILETIGRTPIVRINKLFPENVEVWAKLERANPAGSIKDRIALSMVEDAEAKGLLNSDSIIIEPTSGNTGVGLAMVAAVKGYKLILVMPESMSLERRRLMTAFGANLELTPREKGMRGSIDRANELLQELPNTWMPMQFENEANTRIHAETTAQEILADFPEGFDYHITGVGTGGHITAVTRALKEKFSELKTFAVEPALSPVISGGAPGPHPLQGIGAGFIPAILDTSVLTGTIQVSQQEAFEFTRRAAREEGIFVGISSGASLAAVAKKIPEMPAGSRVLTFCYDTGERYLSVEGLFV
ncbi:cysteine synthase [Adhaeribacter aerolatus]|uniref:Cysteine synthase n=1 Tax=Adhaeribacter aerolatus TaxID=670289 RepID=A0A512AU94_9BACT|nr:cysteine synthase A [Adhaeribacter aerolatus]GEO03260.1 cysteine synthase [Adhaeribacter aerolatus]